MIKESVIHCNFCDKKREYVECIVQLNESTHICNECVDICNNIVTYYRTTIRGFKLLTGKS